MSDPFSAATIAGPLKLKRRPFRSLEPIPTTVQVAFWLLIVSTVVSVAILAISLLSAPWVEYQIAGLSLTPVILPLAVLPLAVALRIYIAVVLRSGYGPARILLSIIAALSLLAEVRGGPDPIGALGLVTLVACVVLTWLPASNRYYSRVAEARKQYQLAPSR
ncbi:MAG: hypothetical protein ABJA11_06275 [Pseudolysinimonas sp.]